MKKQSYKELERDRDDWKKKYNISIITISIILIYLIIILLTIPNPNPNYLKKSNTTNLFKQRIKDYHLNPNTFCKHYGGEYDGNPLWDYCVFVENDIGRICFINKANKQWAFTEPCEAIK